MNQKNEKQGFFELGEAELNELKRQGTEKTFAKGQALWNEGDPVQAVYLVKEGRAHMSKDTSEGSSAIVHFCTHGQMFCPAATIMGKAYPCSAMAATDLTVTVVPRSAFLELFEKLPNLAKGLLKQMAPAVCDAHCRQALAMAPVKSRLASMLGNLHRRFSSGHLPFTRLELAGMSGTTVETTIRTLSEWEKSGVIQSSRGDIQVKRPMVLEEAL